MFCYPMPMEQDWDYISWLFAFMLLLKIISQKKRGYKDSFIFPFLFNSIIFSWSKAFLSSHLIPYPPFFPIPSIQSHICPSNDQKDQNHTTDRISRGGHPTQGGSILLSRGPPSVPPTASNLPTALPVA